MSRARAVIWWSLLAISTAACGAESAQELLGGADSGGLSPIASSDAVASGEAPPADTGDSGERDSGGVGADIGPDSDIGERDSRVADAVAGADAALDAVDTWPIDAARDAQDHDDSTTAADAPWPPDAAERDAGWVDAEIGADSQPGPDGWPDPDAGLPDTATDAEALPDAVALLPGGEPCEAHPQCASGWCGQSSGGKVCGEPCLDGQCPTGYWCGVPTSDSQLWTCLFAPAGMCAPCSENADCGDGRCVESDNGDFCAFPCGPDGACPTGFVCTEDGAADAFPAACLPAGGHCACALEAAAGRTSAPCEKANDHGVCAGVIVCNPAGPFVCSAQVPAPERCNTVDDDCDGAVDEANAQGCALVYLDDDGDGVGQNEPAACECGAPGPGWASLPGDCNDQNGEISPDAPEVCNGVDDDCDGATDPVGAQGCQTFWRDDDGDGYGAPGDSLCLCGPQPPYAALEPGDCQDNDAEVNPQALEVCNNMDDDCDGVLDPVNSPDCKAWYSDADGDGFGNAASSLCLCAPAPPYVVLQAGDCNDADNAIHPDADEVCNGLDDDCDGLVDTGSGAGCTPFFHDGDGDGFGTVSQCLCVPAAPYTALQGGDCNDANASVFPGATTTCGQGPCVQTIQNCVNGVAQTCTPKPSPAGVACFAPPAGCKAVTTGLDACGNPCTKVGPAKCYTVHPACTTSAPGTLTDTPTCTTPKGNFDCDLTPCPGPAQTCGLPSCGQWWNTLGADCGHCQTLSCKKKSGPDEAQFKCNNLPVPATP